jgi:hypothetical protein
MPAATYSEKLTDSRWLDKRAEILDRAKNCCEDCGACKNLQVHHKVYARGKAPWEYENDTLIAVCDACHQLREEVAALSRIVFQAVDPVVAKTFLMTLLATKGQISSIVESLIDPLAAECEGGNDA